MTDHTPPNLCGLPLYLLVDPYFGEPSFVALHVSEEDPPSITQQRREQAWQRKVFAVSSSEHPIAPSSLPYVVALNGSKDEWLEATIEEAEHDHARSLETGLHKISTGTLIETSLDGDALMARLKRMWTIYVSGKRRHLRLASPRVMELVFNSASTENAQAWLGPIERWHHLTRLGQWNRVRGQADMHEHMCDEASYGRHRIREAMAAQTRPSLRLDAALTTTLLHSETITQTLDAWQRMRHRFDTQLITTLHMFLAQATWARADTQEQRIEKCLGHLQRTLGSELS
ncbi:MAG: hypothetical protein ACK4K3_11490 [Aquabacterium sp.]|jgi:hypothetical protein